MRNALKLTAPSVAEVYDRFELRTVLLQLIDTLEPLEREALLRYFWVGQTQKEIAGALRCSGGYIGQLIQRAVRKLNGRSRPRNRWGEQIGPSVLLPWVRS